VARDQGVPVKLFSGTGSADLELRFDHAGAGGIEARLSQLARWVLDADRHGLRYGLALPGARLGPDLGEAHRESCLRALAVHDLADAP
jgi:uncharacterized protein (DUF58 family)